MINATRYFANCESSELKFAHSSWLKYLLAYKPRERILVESPGEELVVDCDSNRVRIACTKSSHLLVKGDLLDKLSVILRAS